MKFHMNTKTVQKIEFEPDYDNYHVTYSIYYIRPKTVKELTEEKVDITKKISLAELEEKQLYEKLKDKYAK